ncbi:DUF3192 domain-containing protein [Candidatus Zixiibacteriota bacterium]
MRFVSIIIIGLVLFGCAGSPAWNSQRISSTRGEAKRNNEKMMLIEVGQDKEMVVGIMGPPTRREAYQLEDDKTIEFLFYRTTGWSPSELGDRDHQFTPVAIESGKLVGWGRNYYEQIIKAVVEVTTK